MADVSCACECLQLEIFFAEMFASFFYGSVLGKYLFIYLCFFANNGWDRFSSPYSAITAHGCGARLRTDLL